LILLTSASQVDGITGLSLFSSDFKSKVLSQMGWHLPVNPALGKLKQEDHEFEVSLSYIKKKKSSI
jgi:hypothetical protein